MSRGPDPDSILCSTWFHQIIHKKDFFRHKNSSVGHDHRGMRLLPCSSTAHKSLTQPQQDKTLNMDRRLSVPLQSIATSLTGNIHKAKKKSFIAGIITKNSMCINLKILIDGCEWEL